MDCHHHAGAAAAASCSGCAEPFCADCLVHVRGAPYCASCKMMAVPPRPPASTTILEDATRALQMAIASFFCFGVVLGPLAIARANEAKRQLSTNPRFGGKGRADAALVLGAIGTALSVLALIQRFAGRR